MISQFCFPFCFSPVYRFDSTIPFGFSFLLGVGSRKKWPFFSHFPLAQQSFDIGRPKRKKHERSWHEKRPRLPWPRPSFILYTTICYFPAVVYYPCYRHCYSWHCFSACWFPSFESFPFCFVTVGWLLSEFCFELLFPFVFYPSCILIICLIHTYLI